MKAQISISLTWVFAIVAGVMVLGMLVSFANKSIESSDFENSISVLNDLDTQITSVAKTKNIFTDMTTPTIRLQNLCEERETSGLLLEGAQNIKPKPYQVIFSEDVLEGSKFFLWTQDWTLQTSVERFLYMTSPNTVYVIVKDPAGEWQEFFEALPTGLPKAVLDFDEITTYNQRGFDTYVFVLFGLDEANRFITVDKNEIPVIVTAEELKAIGLVDHGGYGEAWYIEQEGGGWSMTTRGYYVGDELKLGAVFSEDADHFECNKEKAYFRLAQIARTNLNRAEVIIEELAAGDASCQVSGTDPVPPHCNECLQVWTDVPDQYHAMIDAANGNGNPEMDILQASQELQSIEQDLKKGRNCPTL